MMLCQFYIDFSVTSTEFALGFHQLGSLTCKICSFTLLFFLVLFTIHSWNSENIQMYHISQVKMTPLHNTGLQVSFKNHYSYGVPIMEQSNLCFYPYPTSSLCSDRITGQSETHFKSLETSI